MPQHLEADKLIATIQRLEARIVERFPGSGLSRVAGDLHGISKQAARRAAAIRRPYVPLRLAAWVVILGIIALPAYIAYKYKFNFSSEGWEVMQGVESAISATVFLGGAAFFLVTLERRVKRRRALEAVQELRGLAHIIDMHQLTKDPERAFRKPAEDTASSPKESLSPFLLGRYLDYCSELFSLVSKVCVLYGQGTDDEVVLGAVDEIEDLTGGLARRVWQKIMLLDNLEARIGKAEAVAATKMETPASG